MSKYYIYNCLIKNDINLVWLASLFSFFHCVAFYNEQGLISKFIVISSFIISSATLFISSKTKTILNLKQAVSITLLLAVIMACFNAIQTQDNNISGIFITVLNLGILILGFVNIKCLFHTIKIENLRNDIKPMSFFDTSEIIDLYKLSIYEVIRLSDGYESKRSVFYDFKINMIIDGYDFKSMNDSKTYSLIDFAHHCKDQDINIKKITKEDFEVFKMMII